MTRNIYSDYHLSRKPSRSTLTKRPRKNPIDWLSDPYNHARGETALWVAVITQAMMDALSRSGNAEIRYHREEALRWLTGNSRDFKTVCCMAGMDPDYVRRKAKQALACPRPWRAEAGKGARYLERREYRKRLQTEKTKEPAADVPPPQKILAGPW